jgi:hypothetical protein
VRTSGVGIAFAVGCLLVPCWVLAQVAATTVAHDPRLPIALAEARRDNWRCLMPRSPPVADRVNAASVERRI